MTRILGFGVRLLHRGARRLAVAVALVIAIASCGTGSEQPDVPDTADDAVEQPGAAEDWAERERDDRPPHGPAGDIDGSVPFGSGPHRMEAGIPVGYARDEAGAVAAAVNLMVVLDSPVMLDADRRNDIFELTVADASRPGLEEQAEWMTVQLDEMGGLTAELFAADGAVWRTTPAGWQLLGFDESQARVAVWAVSVMFTPQGAPMAPHWGTTTVTLVWEDGDWKLADLHGVQGPTPPGPGDLAAVGEVGPAIARFEPLWHLPAPTG